MNTLMILLSAMILFSSCQETERIFIADHRVDCEGVAPQKCMLFKKDKSQDWTYFYDSIEGFDYEEGYLYELEVRVAQIENPPADGSSLHYALIKIISKEKAKSIAQHIAVEKQKQQEYALKTITYQASSRGFFLEITIDKDVIKKATDRNANAIASRKCSKKDWNTIRSLIYKTPIETIDKLTAPTEKRHLDGAAHAQLKVISKDTVFTSNTFDHGNPPEEIKLLVNTILSLAESIE